jgi:hypothetical protein
MEPISKQFANLGKENRDYRKELSVAYVDQLADEIVHEYSTPRFRKWYLSLIYELGPQAIKDIRGRCRDARHPGKLFSKLAKEQLSIKRVKKIIGG